ncbi:MAG: hypothetical protein LBU60_03860 [Clostridiales bacterium]|jgi:hypothetical protein|nr:hypothetical protein [Clostridiales bacterium]
MQGKRENEKDQICQCDGRIGFIFVDECFFACSKSPVTYETQLVGEWFVTNGTDDSISALSIRSDKTFVEQSFAPGGAPVDEYQGTWSVSGDVMTQTVGQLSIELTIVTLQDNKMVLRGTIQGITTTQEYAKNNKNYSEMIQGKWKNVEDVPNSQGGSTPYTTTFEFKSDKTYSYSYSYLDQESVQTGTWDISLITLKINIPQQNNWMMDIAIMSLSENKLSVSRTINTQASSHPIDFDRQNNL